MGGYGRVIDFGLLHRAVFLLVLLWCNSAVMAQAVMAQQFETVEEQAAQSFFAKHHDCGGIAVRASAAVEDRALLLACGKIMMLLQRMPQARQRLVELGAELHIIGRNEQTSDLPEFQDQRGVTFIDETGKTTTIDERTRGMGGLQASCGEENLLHLPGDRYWDGSDICVHEFSHTIMDYGLDENQQAQIQQQYTRATTNGLWLNAYAATNPQEYWAELTTWYFGAHGDRRMSGTPPADGVEGLRIYDPEGFALLNHLYNGGS